MRLALVVAAVLLAGCQMASEEWVLGGTFTTERTQADLDAVCEAVGRAQCAFMESFPEQYRFSFPSEAECRAAYERVRAIPHTLPRECVLAA